MFEESSDHTFKLTDIFSIEREREKDRGTHRMARSQMINEGGGQDENKESGRSILPIGN